MDPTAQGNGAIPSLRQFIVEAVGDLRPKTALPRAYYVPDFLTEQEEEQLLSEVNGAPKPKWTVLKDRRLQNWGGLPSAKGMVAEALPPWLDALGGRLTDMGVFPRRPNHVLVNEYLAGQGIMPHEDGPVFDPVIATVNLGSHTVIDFYRFMSDEERAREPSQVDDARDESTMGADTSGEVHPSLAHRHMFSLVLQPRSLLVLTDAMYTGCMHGIEGRKTDTPSPTWVNAAAAGVAQDAEPLTRDTRVSLTIRHVAKTVKVKLRLGK